jgi:hypothetical protein
MPWSASGAQMPCSASLEMARSTWVPGMSRSTLRNAVSACTTSVASDWRSLFARSRSAAAPMLVLPLCPEQASAGTVPRGPQLARKRGELRPSGDVRRDRFPSLYSLARASPSANSLASRTLDWSVLPEAVASSTMSLRRRHDRLRIPQGIVGGRALTLRAPDNRLRCSRRAAERGTDAGDARTKGERNGISTFGDLCGALRLPASVPLRGGRAADRERRSVSRAARIRDQGREP